MNGEKAGKPHIHLIGIGGAGLSAIATVLYQWGYTVSGSDMQSSMMTDLLARLGIKVFIGHRAQNLRPEVDAVVVSSAIPADNPEWQEALRRGIPVFKRAEWLGKMMAGKTGIALAGTHGKTTTTALTAYLLQEAGQSPSYIIGGYVPQLKTNAAAGQGDAFVIEADEYDHTFLGFRPNIAAVTTIEWDHPDIFPSPQALQADFEQFVAQVPPDGLVIGCGDDPVVRRVIRHARCRTVTYGLEAENDWQATGLRLNEDGGYNFTVLCRDETYRPALAGVEFGLAVPGRHNVRNALAGLIIAVERGIAPAQAADIIRRFQGVGRRFELKGEMHGVIVIDDYAHHPTEIRATLAAARDRFGDRPLWVVFQPHTFSRTAALLDEFAAAFTAADHVIVVDIFPSREVDEGRVHSRDIVTRMDHPDARYIGSLADAASDLLERMTPPAVLLTLGAGDGYKVGEMVLKYLVSSEVMGPETEP